MANLQGTYNETTGTNDSPPSYLSVVGNPQYGFIPPSGVPYPRPEGAFIQPKLYNSPGVYPHSPPNTAAAQMQDGVIASTSSPATPVGVVETPADGTEQATVICTNCGKVVATGVPDYTDWWKGFITGSVCIGTMICSLCCGGMMPH